MKLKTLNQNKTLKSFIAFYANHSELRFWQVIRAFSGKNFILISSHFDPDMFNWEFMKKNKVEVSDTYYFKGKSK